MKPLGFRVLETRLVKAALSGFSVAFVSLARRRNRNDAQTSRPLNVPRIVNVITTIIVTV